MSKGKIGYRVTVTDGSSDGHTGIILSVDDHGGGGILIKRDADGVEVRVSNYSVHKPPAPEKGELVMRVEVVILHKMVTLQGIIECDRIKPGDRVVIEYEGQNIPAKIFAIESFNKMHEEATQGQGVALDFIPTPELLGIKKSYSVVDGKYVLEKSTAFVWRDNNETSVVRPGA